MKLVLCAVALLFSAAGIAPATAAPAPVSAAASWLSREVTTPGTKPGAGVDTGLIADMALAQAADPSQPVQLASTLRILDGSSGQGDVKTGMAIKLLLLAATTGQDPHSFTTDPSTHKRVDLRTLAESRVSTTPGTEGAFLDTAARPDSYVNSFQQSLGVIAMARTGGVSSGAITFLLRQQCSAGYVRIQVSASTTCDQDGSSGSVDATAVALQAFLTVRNAGASIPGLDAGIEHATAYLVGEQHSDGGFPSDKGIPQSNSNSTGLAAQALRAVGKQAEADKASAFITSLQLTTGSDAGAIAYDAAALKQAPGGVIPGAMRGQWRLATAQAALGLGAPMLGTLCAGCTDAKATVAAPPQQAAPAASAEKATTTMSLAIRTIAISAAIICVIVAVLVGLRARRRRSA